MKKQRRGIKVEPDTGSIKLVGYGIIAVLLLLLVHFLTSIGVKL